VPLGPSRTSDGLVPETDAGLSQGLDQRVDIIDLDDHAIPPAWLRATAVRHRPGGGGVGSADPKGQILQSKDCECTGPRRSTIEKPGFTVLHSRACSTSLTMYLTVATEYLPTPELERRLTARISCVAGKPRPT
jgi:hypothetical protein